jgi:hypothetical protein
MKKVLLVVQEIPEFVRFFSFFANDQEIEVLKEANGRFVNSCNEDPSLDENDATLNVYNAISKKGTTNSEFVGYDESWESKWVDNEVKLPIAAVDVVFTIGFFL